MNTHSLRENVRPKAAFVVKILYQQDSDLQGVITWIGEKKTVCFRNRAELLRLMESASFHQASKKAGQGSLPFFWAPSAN